MHVTKWRNQYEKTQQSVILEKGKTTEAIKVSKSVRRKANEQMEHRICGQGNYSVYLWHYTLVQIHRMYNTKSEH